MYKRQTAARSPLATANAAASGALTEQDAIQAARTCFETLCDTSIFSFDEYTVSCERTRDAYTVLMTSIYGLSLIHILPVPPRVTP